jgi:hypothetical protein
MRGPETSFLSPSHSVWYLFHEPGVHEIEMVVRIVQGEVQMNQSTKLGFKDLFFWKRPLLVSEFQHNFESIPFHRLIELCCQDEADCHRETTIGFGDESLQRRGWEIKGESEEPSDKATQRR